MPKVARLDDLFAMLTLQLPRSVEEPVMRQALQAAFSRFCDESKAWRQNLTPITTVAAQTYYTVINPWEG